MSGWRKLTSDGLLGAFASETLQKVIAALVVGALTGLTVWAWTLSVTVAAIDVNQRILTDQQHSFVMRLSAIEGGNIYPMSFEAKLRLGVLTEQLTRVESVVEELQRGQQEILSIFSGRDRIEKAR